MRLPTLSVVLANIQSNGLTSIDNFVGVAIKTRRAHAVSIAMLQHWCRPLVVVFDTVYILLVGLSGSILAMISVGWGIFYLMVRNGMASYVAVQMIVVSEIKTTIQLDIKSTY